MSSSILYLNNWQGNGPAALVNSGPAYAQARNLYTLSDIDLNQYAAVLLPSNSDQRFLVKQQVQLEAYLQQGGTMVINGHIAHPFLSCLTAFQPVAYRGVESFMLQRVAHHPIFKDVTTQDLTFRRGVAGFYSRGGNPAPAEAFVIHTIGAEQLPVDWILTLPEGGRVFVHSGNDLWMFGGSQDSTQHVIPQLFQWLRGETN